MTQTFRQFLMTAFEHGDYTTDDVIASVLPLFRTVLKIHEDQLVAPFGREEALIANGQELSINAEMAGVPQFNLPAINALTRTQSPHFEVVDKLKVTDEQTVSLRIQTDVQQAVKHPAYIPGYESYEMLLDHHDEQTDIFCLGLVLGSIAMGLDLYDDKELQLFVTHRSHPSRYKQRIHPAIGTLIAEMTELDRHKRTQDLYEAIHRLEHYRDFDPEKQIDLAEVAGWGQTPRNDRNAFILNKLRNRLFDTSRRNRLLYYKSNARFVNLTISSVPMVLHYQSIRPQLLFTWNDDIAANVKDMKDMSLNKYLRFDDHPYLPAALNKIRVEAQHDIQEFGFSQLKLVIAFLNWHNLRDEADERIQSPLLLIPVELKKKKSVTEDQYMLKVTANEAEVNPVLANFLHELYGIKLPDFIDLDDMSLQQFYQLLQVQIEGANRGIVLQYADKPRINLVYKEARQTVNQYLKRLNKPGLPPDTTAVATVTAEAAPQLITDPVSEKEMFTMAESESNPYRWDFDVCNIVLGNFNYKKMSLVRDYNSVMEQDVTHEVFTQLFSAQPRPLQNSAPDAPPPDRWFHVINADPTQARAISQARTGESYIIQGPPGTGKSQTITNLLADFVARGKTVLFVCEKRAALDVVYHRLKQQGLDELCCYIHDSQGDKRSFIRNLKATYEDFLQKKMDLHSINLKRSALLHNMQEQVQLLEQYHNINAGEQDLAGVTVHRLIEKVIAMRPLLQQLQPKDEEQLPHYQQWLQFGQVVEQLGKALEDSGASPAFAEHPVSHLNEQVFSSPQPHALLEQLLAQTQQLLDAVIQVVQQNQVDAAYAGSIEGIRQLVLHATLLQPLAETGNLGLVDPANAAAQQFDQQVTQYKLAQQSQAAIAAQNGHWKRKFNQQDTLHALEVAREQEDAFLRFLNGTWRQLKAQLEDSYDFSQHAVKPAYSAVLAQLKSEYDATERVNELYRQLQQQYRIDNLDMTRLAIERMRLKLDDRSLQYLLQHPDANKLVKQLAGLHEILNKLDQQLRQCLADPTRPSVQELLDDLENISINADSLDDLLPALGNYVNMPDGMKQAVRRMPFTPDQLEANMAHKTLRHIYQYNKSFANTDSLAIEKAVGEIRHCYKQLLKLNADCIRANIRQQFQHHVDISNRALSQLQEDEQAFKKSYMEGRRILENEFAKSMRYKSIRELAEKESGLVLKDLKPVWLMSPLSVSDSLPLDISFFDAVIFDEASQITLEEGVPTLYRAPQAIIVGDEKQMPPTDFFAAKTGDPDDLEVNDDDEDDDILSADADSLLVQGARKMQSVMLGWHYRSLYETLISYSNHAFYDASLLTIPDRSIHHLEKTAIESKSPEDAAAHTAALFDRSISYHFITHGQYVKRSNAGEAAYIAEMIRALLQQQTRESIGIVAFSQEQQKAIEAALEALAAKDKQFAQLLEEAQERTDDDQFTGLFVKNLENVQGDERDIMILSICYAPDKRGKMAMNFGPINKKGGEKRLNVIFSRARKHMAVVASIKHSQITNEYNAGANYFKRFLHYAENVSSGNMQQARQILDGLLPQRFVHKQRTGEAVIRQQVRHQLEQRGFTVAEQVGQSGFRCSLAVKITPDDPAYTLSIIIDDETYYSNPDVIEQYYQRPALLENAGWRTMTVFAKDWLHQPQRVMDSILKKLQHIKEEVVATPVTPQSLFPDVAPVATVGAYDALTFRRFTQTGRFWEVATDGAKLIIRSGKNGAKGQLQVKTLASSQAAVAGLEKLVEDKVKEGWQELSE
ncbi:AAA domain-containing protein [Chitinophaga horti]|uniref:AAA domain-containing protein n=1 Tax=Chitinophaga horti TaxID=2920382 RepID=A0ABY6J9P0_9BACT|nr:AAA domain-containing protein [Chitinophaga horti]UYQ95057.1 AAA domain-containing protein [Chitinophaga horti]